MDDQIAQFSAITSATPEQATQFLQLADNDLEQAIELFFASGDLDVGGSTQTQVASAPRAPPRDEDIIDLDSDDEMTGTSTLRPAAVGGGPSVEDDEAMARRLQEEMYGGAGGLGNQEEVRAPTARTTETLLGPGSHWDGDDDDDVHAAVAQQIMARQQRRSNRPGIFNQRDPYAGQPSSRNIWNEGDDDVPAAPGSASEDSKRRRLKDLFEPPWDLKCRLPWDQARDKGKEEEKWLLVEVQHKEVFDCQRLNRDIWKDEQVKATVRENFLFMQFWKDDPQGTEYMQYYFQDRENRDNYAHIAIVDPRTGEQVKVWSAKAIFDILSPKPKPQDFLMQLHEFLDRYSLKDNVRNPVVITNEEKKVDFDRMTEDEQIEWALKNSMGNNGDAPTQDSEPDALTRNQGTDDTNKGKQKAEDSESAPDSAFTRIQPKEHTEPASDPTTTTRIQFRHSGGRTIRRFALASPVEEIYQWLKASPIDGKEGVEFTLSSMGKDLIEQLDSTIQEAGLKNATVMVDYFGE